MRKWRVVYDEARWAFHYRVETKHHGPRIHTAWKDLPGLASKDKGRAIANAKEAQRQHEHPDVPPVVVVWESDCG